MPDDTASESAGHFTIHESYDLEVRDNDGRLKRHVIVKDGVTVKDETYIPTEEVKN